MSLLGGIIGRGVAEAGHYLTDGCRLYRVVNRCLIEGLEPAAVVEDCLTLEVRLYTSRELWAMRLRRVERRPERELVPA
jgi:hypothetical protein